MTAPLDDGFRVYAAISAKILHALGPIVRAAREGDGTSLAWDGSLFLYPHEDGVLCIATDGKMLAAVIDRTGQLTNPAQFCIPDDLIEACAPRPPIVGFYEGDAGELAFPAWAQPGAVVLSYAGAYVAPQMRHPADFEDAGGGHSLFTRLAEIGRRHHNDDFRAREPKLDPRTIFGALNYPTIADVRAGPDRIAAFSDIARLLGGDVPIASIQSLSTGHVVIRVHECPDFIGIISPLASTVEHLDLLDINRFAPPPETGAPPASDHPQRAEGAAR